MRKNKKTVTLLRELRDDRFYRIADLQAILERLGLNYSIFTIRDYETWKCLDYKCGKRHNRKVTVCEGLVRLKRIRIINTGEVQDAHPREADELIKKGIAEVETDGEPVTKKVLCGGLVREPLIISPRTRGGGKGPGHRRYTAQEVKSIVDIFKQRE